ncbi:MAG: hypothetical protein ACOY81_06600, partial [Bacillota bacterium]
HILSGQRDYRSGECRVLCEVDKWLLGMDGTVVRFALPGNNKAEMRNRVKYTRFFVWLPLEPAGVSSNRPDSRKTVL